MLLSIIMVSACQSNGQDTSQVEASVEGKDVDMNDNVLKTEQDYIDFLVETYGFKASDFDNMDVIKFVTDYSLDTEIASKEDAQMLYK